MENKKDLSLSTEATTADYLIEPIHSVLKKFMESGEINLTPKHSGTVNFLCKEIAEAVLNPEVCDARKAQESTEADLQTPLISKGGAEVEKLAKERFPQLVHIINSVSQVRKIWIDGYNAALTQKAGDGWKERFREELPTPLNSVGTDMTEFFLHWIENNLLEKQ